MRDETNLSAAKFECLDKVDTYTGWLIPHRPSSRFYTVSYMSITIITSGQVQVCVCDLNNKLKALEGSCKEENKGM